ncbi:MAG: hypothetical protein ACM3UY_05625 [Methanocella sp.]|jgi:hypothetical protein
MYEALVFVAAAASFITAALYIRAMFRGAAKPNRVTWLMWSIAPFIGTAAAVYSGVTWAAVPVFMMGFSPFLIFIASFFTEKAYWKLGGFDYLCGGLSALALLLWVVTMDPDVSIMLAIVSDAIAAVPTLTKAYRMPQTEAIWPFLTGIFNSTVSLIVAVTWSFAEVAFPIYLLALNLLLVALLARAISSRQ